MQIPTKIDIPQFIEIGILIGHGRHNLKPIAERTGTHIQVNTNMKPAQIEIKINNHFSNASYLLPSEDRIDRINEAKDQLNKLIKDIEMKRNERINERRINQQGLKKKAKFQKEIDLKKERKNSERERKYKIDSE